MYERDGFTQSEKSMMLLSKETRLGLRITGEYTCIVKVIISLMYSVMYSI